MMWVTDVDSRWWLEIIDSVDGLNCTAMISHSHALTTIWYGMAMTIARSCDNGPMMMASMSFPRHTSASGGAQSTLQWWHVMMGDIDVDVALGSNITYPRLLWDGMQRICCC